MEQLVARRAHNPKVIGSSPVPATLEKPVERLAFSVFRGSESCLSRTIENGKRRSRAAAWLLYVKPPFVSIRHEMTDSPVFV